MQLTKITDIDKTLEIIIEGEDLALGDILHHELLEDDEVVFAGAILAHPLMKKTNLRVQTKGMKPIDAVIASGKRAASNASKILDEVKSITAQKAKQT